MPNQAVLVDMAHERFYFFFIEIWPQEVYYITGLLILAALGMFLAAALFGRVWCGYTCPQTVWTDLFIAVETLDRRRPQRPHPPCRPSRCRPRRSAKRVAKHASLASDRAWRPAAPGCSISPMRRRWRAAGHGHGRRLAYAFIGMLTFTTYSLGGLMREQVCTYMCPWPRIQAALIDHETLSVAYRTDRGEPRGPHKKGQTWEGRGALHRLQPMRGRLPDGHRHPRRRAARMHQLRAVHRCLRRGDGQDRPAQGLIAYDTDANIERRTKGEAIALPLRAAAHDDLCGAAAADRRHHDLQSGHARDAGPGRAARPQSDLCAPVRRLGAQRLYDQAHEPCGRRRARLCSPSKT